MEKAKVYLERSKDVNVVTASSRAEALETMKSGKPAAVICDHVPPELDGTELLRETRSTGNDVPFVMLTAEDRRDLLMKAIMKDADLCFQPATISSEVVLPELSQRLNRALKQIDDEDELKRRLAMEELIADVSTRLLDSRPPDIDAEIRSALGKVGEFIGALRCYFLVSTPDGKKILKAYDWPEDSKGKSMDLMSVDLSVYGWAIERIKRGESIVVNDLDALMTSGHATPEMMAVFERWREDGVTRIIGIPLMMNGELKGLFGYTAGNDSSRWTDEDVRLATIFSNTVAAGLGRMEYEQRLTKEKDKFKAIADYTYNWESWIDNDLRLRWVNPEVERMTGYTVEECMAMPDYPIPIVLEDDRHLATEWFKGKGGTGRATRGDQEFRIKRKDGGIVEAAVSWRPAIREDGAHLGYRASVQDISERKHMETELQRAFAQLSLLNRVTRHEMTHQLTILRKGFDECRVGNGAHDPELLEKVGKSIDRMNRLLRLLEDFQNVGDSAPVWQNVGEIVESALEGAPKDVKVRIAVGETEVLADPMLERVFSHLLENSLTHGGGVKNIVVESKATEDGISIVYRDDGVGIPFEKKKELFVRDRKHQPARGLILGSEILAVTGMSIVETGAPGKGARFEVQIPADRYRVVTGQSAN
ncbi:MAG: PAS domain S-box protein [Methanomassiliicoccales archaeon]|nr:PAS domain S-box protein [Methanomassiliicoccales archaeon]